MRMHLHTLTCDLRNLAIKHTHALQVRLTDVSAIDCALDTLQHGTLEGDTLSTKSCIQLFRLLQLVRVAWRMVDLVLERAVLRAHNTYA